MSTSRTTAFRSASALSLVAACTLGCSAGTDRRAAPSRPSASASTTVAPTHDASRDSTSPADPSGTEVAACQPDQLRLSRFSQGSGGDGPGNYHAVFLLTNNRSSPCTVSGVPDVAFVHDDGSQVRASAPKAATAPPQQITLGPGKVAQFTLRAAVYEGPRCPGGAVRAEQLRVLLPGQPSAGLLLRGPFVFCALTQVTQFVRRP